MSRWRSTLTSASRPCRPGPRNSAWLALPLSAALLAAQTQTTPTFRTEVALVHADAEVVEDGRILDEGKPQPIVQFSAGEQPLDLILLFDISGSMRLVVKQVAAASQQAYSTPPLPSPNRTVATALSVVPEAMAAIYSTCHPG